MAEKNYFEVLNGINVNDKVEKKNGLSYLSWAYAWGELKKKYPEATYTIYENADGWNYFTDGLTCWVKTGVTVQGIEHIEYLPIMDFRNKSIPTEQVTSFDVNKAIQRSLTKAVARHGLGLYIYAGEDLPDEYACVEPSKPVKKAESPKNDIKQVRQKFVATCQKYQIDPGKAASEFGLNNDSTVADFENAIMVILDRVRKANKEA